jgi:16S rRNA (uracil1498-N3)-methyltransferase
VNLLLLDPEELRADGTFVVSDRRAQHLSSVLGVEVGSQVRVGIIGGAIGTAEVLVIALGAITMRFTATKATTARVPVDLVLAIPRPKVITRTIEIAASFGVGRIELTNAWKVDKSYLGSPRLDAGALALAARFGAEQGATTTIPEIRVHERLMALLDERYAAAPPAGGELRLIAHPHAPPIESVVMRADPTVLAIGPEGGWIDRELDTFVERGFKPVSIGTPILRVEAAVAAALGQLELLHRMRRA